jgi:hypothetical protein
MTAVKLETTASVHSRHWFWRGVEERITTVNTVSGCCGFLCGGKSEFQYLRSMRPQFRFVLNSGLASPGFGRFRFFSGLGQLVSFRFVSIKTRPSLLSFVSFHDNETHKFSCPSFGFQKKMVSISSLQKTIIWRCGYKNSLPLASHPLEVTVLCW